MSAPPDIVILSHGAVSSVRQQREPRGIQAALAQLGPPSCTPGQQGVRLIQCAARALPVTLQEVCGAGGIAEREGARVWLHLMGHHCALSPRAADEAVRRQAIEPREAEIVHLGASGEPVRTVVDVSLDFDDFVAGVAAATPQLELVFCNASHTNVLADALPVLNAFGWTASCIEEDAIVFSNSFYAAIAKGRRTDQAFALATEAVATTSPPADKPATAVNPPDDSVAEELVNADAWTQRSSKRKRDETDASSPADAVELHDPTVVDGCNAGSDNKNRARCDDRPRGGGQLADSSTRRDDDGREAPVAVPPVLAAARTAAAAIATLPDGPPDIPRRWMMLARQRHMHRAGPGIPLRPTTLVGIGETKINKLAKLDVRLVATLRRQ